jgi:hypothetical protein
VIKVPKLPVACGVAALALLAKPPLMHIFLLVATDTVQRYILEQQRLMTFLAVHDAMLPTEGETSLVMVECEGFPGRLTMAVLALLPLLPVMLVVFFVTGITVSRCFLFVEVSLMAGFTFCGLVLSFQ